MTAERWVWITLGLVVWAVVLMWTNGPSHCTPPDPKTHQVTCHYNRGPRR